MQFRPIAVTAIVAWVAAECWAAPWNPVFWPAVHWSILLGIFALLFVLGVRPRTVDVVVDLSVITIGATVAASIAWNLWMMHGWFHWEWVHWLSTATKSDGEGAYRMVEYQFFLILFVAAVVVWQALRPRIRAR